MNRDRRRQLLIAAGALLAVPGSVYAQLPAKISRIGMLIPVRPADASSKIEAFQQGLGGLGYVDGQNIIIEPRYSEGRDERLRDLAVELVNLKVDVIVIWGTPAARAARTASRTIPIVSASVVDPVGTGFIVSLARPGGNITGISMAVGESFPGKWVELLRDAVPGVSHVAALVNSTSSVSGIYVKEMRAAARALNMKLDVFAAGNNAAEIEEAFAAIGASGAQGLIVPADTFFFIHRARLVQLAASKRLPAVYWASAIVNDGGLMAYGPSLVEAYRQVAVHVAKILKGAKPGELPIEQPTRFELVINLKTAKALGLKIPQSVLLRADQVIE